MSSSAEKKLSVREQVTEGEWKTRVDLAAAYRLVGLYGWDDLIFTHISARAPGPEHHFLINPYGMMFDEITASSLVKVDLDGNVVMESPYFINPAGFTIHSAVHAARSDALCVMGSSARAGELGGACPTTPGRSLQGAQQTWPSSSFWKAMEAATHAASPSGDLRQ